MCFFYFFYTANVYANLWYFYRPIVPEINYSILFYNTGLEIPKPEPLILCRQIIKVEIIKPRRMKVTWGFNVYYQCF